MVKVIVDMMAITDHIVWDMLDGTAKQADRVLILFQIITTAQTAVQICERRMSHESKS